MYFHMSIRYGCSWVLSWFWERGGGGLDDIPPPSIHFVAFLNVIYSIYKAVPRAAMQQLALLIWHMAEPKVMEKITYF